MNPARRVLYFAVFLAGCLLLQSVLARDVPFVPTPEAVVDEMLQLAKVGPRDVVYDLGSGDGRIVIAAAQKHGARSVGIDIDPQRIQEAQENAGTRVVSHAFQMGDWQPVETRKVGATTVYYWVVPDRLSRQ